MFWSKSVLEASGAIHKSQSNKVASRPRKRPKFRLGLERLETRTVMAASMVVANITEMTQQAADTEYWTTNPYYGNRGTYFADVTGDGRADAIVVNNGGVTVRRSTGTGFSPNETWTANPYYGNRGTFFADVTGDGKADAIVVNDGGVTIRRSTGTGFSPNESWTANPYYGSRGTFFADVTGDGKADAIVVNDGGVTVRRSTGTGFAPNESWTANPYYGVRGTFFADVTGDGRADAIVVNDGGVTIRRSTGAAFLPNETWTANPYYGSKGTFFVDVSGDGRADATVVNNDAIAIRRSVDTWKVSVVGSDNSDQIAVTENSGRFRALANGMVIVDMPANTIRSIEIHGGAGNDWIDGRNSTKPLVVHGDDGEDTILGGSNGDFLYGDNGNDNLYGGEGRDSLFGGNGNDRLFAGFTGIGYETLFGGSGADRYLISCTERTDILARSGIEDGDSQDAVIKFLAGTNPWTDGEILQVDEGLARLQALTNNTKLLKQSDSSRLTFLRWNDLGPSVLGDNNDKGTIRVSNLAFTAGNLSSVVIHEIGHNWDDENSAWAGFLGLSGWVRSPVSKTGLTPGQFTDATGAIQVNGENWWRRQNNLAAFARDYGRYTPFEDWSTTWEVYLANPVSVTAVAPSGNAVLTQKLQAVDSFFARMRT